MRPTIVSLLLVALLSVPTAAFAQSAGDDQYRDPLAPSQEPNGNGSGGGGGGGGSGASGGGSGQGEPVQEAQSSGDAQENATSAQAGDQLPATGFPSDTLAFAGVALLGAGVVLRRAAGWLGP